MLSIICPDKVNVNLSLHFLNESTNLKISFLSTKKTKGQNFEHVPISFLDVLEEKCNATKTMTKHPVWYIFYLQLSLAHRLSDVDLILAWSFPFANA